MDPLHAKPSDAGTRPGPHYWPALDGIRALAVSAVFLQHVSGPESIFHRLELGWIGVHTFFVLSGFLITEILLGCRRGVEAGRAPALHTMRQFYARRFLRIFPVYFAALFASALFAMKGVRETFWWHATFATNIYTTLKAQGVWAVGHFWSLSVEEQFYLVWPWLIVLTPRKWVGRVILGSIALGVACRLMGTVLGVHAFVLYTSTFTCVDSLGLGALLAYVSSQSRPASARAVMGRAGLWIGVPLLIGLSIATLAVGVHRPQMFLYNIAVALTAVWAVTLATSGSLPPAARWLAWGPLAYLGKISYGLYVYHMMVLMAVPKLLGRLGLSYPDNLALRVLIVGSALVALASASWWLMERPINELKSRFPYFAQGRRTAPPADSAIETRDGLPPPQARAA